MTTYKYYVKGDLHDVYITSNERLAEEYKRSLQSLHKDVVMFAHKEL